MPKQAMLIPKFLTEKDALFCIDHVVNSLFANLDFPLNRRMCHVVVLCPSMPDDRVGDYPKWPVYPLEPALLAEKSFGDKNEWTASYDDIGRCKVLQRWHNRYDEGTDIIPHLLFPGDTPYWGSVKREFIATGCSGVKPYFDKMIAGNVTDMIIALAYHRWMESEDRINNVNFLTYEKEE